MIATHNKQQQTTLQNGENLTARLMHYNIYISSHYQKTKLKKEVTVTIINTVFTKRSKMANFLKKLGDVTTTKYEGI